MTTTETKTCHCGQPAQGPPSEYPSVCSQWPICGDKSMSSLPSARETKSITATIGWTISDLPRYSSFDGYQKGERQHEETITFEVPSHFDDERVCWVLLDATNCPLHAMPENSHSAFQAIKATGYRGEQAHFSLSKGDTITINGVQRAFTGLDIEVV